MLLCRHTVPIIPQPRLALPDTKPEGPPEAVANLALGLLRSETALDGSALLPYPCTPVSCQGASLAASVVTMPALSLAAASAVALGEPQSKGVLLRFDVGAKKGEAGWSTPSKGKELTLVMMPLSLCMTNGRRHMLVGTYAATLQEETRGRRCSSLGGRRGGWMLASNNMLPVSACINTARSTHITILCCHL